MVKPAKPNHSMPRGDVTRESENRKERKRNDRGDQVRQLPVEVSGGALRAPSRARHPGVGSGGAADARRVRRWLVGARCGGGGGGGGGVEAARAGRTSTGRGGARSGRVGAGGTERAACGVHRRSVAAARAGHASAGRGGARRGRVGAGGTQRAAFGGGCGGVGAGGAARAGAGRPPSA